MYAAEFLFVVAPEATRRSKWQTEESVALNVSIMPSPRVLPRSRVDVPRMSTSIADKTVGTEHAKIGENAEET